MMCREMCTTAAKVPMAPGVCWIQVLVLALAAGAAQSATVVQPDIRGGVSRIDVNGFSSGQDVGETGGQIDAEVRIAMVDERGSFSIVPKIMSTYYGGNDLLEREEQRLTLDWTRLFQTGDTHFVVDFSRKDLFSSEFEDADADPDGGSPGNDNDSGVVGDGMRNRLYFLGGVTKQLTQRGDLVVDLDYVDIAYDDASSVSRVDFNQAILNGGYRFQASERTAITVMIGGRRYDGDNGVQVDSYTGDARVDFVVSESMDVYFGAGYESLDGTQNGTDLGTESIVPIEIGVDKHTELTHYNLEIGRFVRPGSTGEFRERTSASFRLQRRMTERFTVEFGLAAYRDDQLGSQGTPGDRTYLSGKLDLDWALSRRWSVGFEYFHNQQDFSGIAPPATAVESRDELFLNVRFRGLDRTSPTL